MSTDALLSATGPQGLVNVLDQLLEQKRASQLAADSEQYIKYRNGEHESLIKVDMHANPLHFWCYDYLFGRPVPSVVNVLMNFVWEKGGEKEAYLAKLKKETSVAIEEIDVQKAYEQWQQIKHTWLRDIGKERREKEQANFLSGGNWVSSKEPFLTKNNDEALDDAMRLLASEHTTPEVIAVKAPAKSMWSSFFPSSAKSPSSSSATLTPDKPKPINRPNTSSSK